MGKCQPPAKLEFNGTYKGAEVLAPKKGLYDNIVVVDAKSLYPSVGINYNLSFDTINCYYRKDNPKTKISNLLSKNLLKIVNLLMRILIGYVNARLVHFQID